MTELKLRELAQVLVDHAGRAEPGACALPWTLLPALQSPVDLPLTTPLVPLCLWAPGLASSVLLKAAGWKHPLLPVTQSSRSPSSLSLRVPKE